MDKVTVWLLANGKAEEMATFYTSLIADSHIDEVMRSPGDYPGGKAGDVLTVSFTIAGRAFACLNGGPDFPFSQAMSLQIECADQAEVDRYWTALSAHPEAEQCGWVKDRFGLSWQIVPKRLMELMTDPDRDRAGRAMAAMMGMKKLDIAALEAAANGGSREGG